VNGGWSWGGSAWRLGAGDGDAAIESGNRTAISRARENERRWDDIGVQLLLDRVWGYRDGGLGCGPKPPTG
jgi:hypothetical protein